MASGTVQKKLVGISDMFMTKEFATGYGAGSGSTNVAVSGYTPIAFCGKRVYDSIAAGQYYQLYFSDTNTVQWNFSSAPHAGGRGFFRVLYVKNA